MSHEALRKPFQAMRPKTHFFQQIGDKLISHFLLEADHQQQSQPTLQICKNINHNS